MVVCQERFASDEIRKRVGYYMDPIQERILPKLFLELEEDDATRVTVQQETQAFVPQVCQTTVWKMQIGDELVLLMWQGGTLHVELQPAKLEWYWFTWTEVMEEHKKVQPLDFLRACGFPFVLEYKDWLLYVCLVSSQFNFVRNVRMTYSFGFESVMLANDYINA